jgi:hypothetical protein
VQVGIIVAAVVAESVGVGTVAKVVVARVDVDVEKAPAGKYISEAGCVDSGTVLAGEGIRDVDVETVVPGE